MNHDGFCRFQHITEEQQIVCPKNENEIVISKLNGRDKLKEASILNPNKSARKLSGDEPSTRLGYLMCLRPVTFSSQSYILAGYESGIFLTWDLRMNAIINEAQFDENAITLDFCSKTNRGAYGNINDTLIIIEYQQSQMKLVKRTAIPVKNAINCVRIRGDQKILSTGGSDGRVRIFSWKSLRQLAVLTEHSKSVNDIAYSDDKVDLWQSQIMATADSDGQISLWNLFNK